MVMVCVLGEVTLSDHALCAHHRLCWWAVMKNEEAQQNWLLTPWLHGTDRFLAGMRRHTTYVKLNIQVQAVLLTFRVQGDGVCFWQSDSVMMCTVYLQAVTKRFKQVYRKTIKIVCGCGLESLYFRSGYRNRSVIGSKKYQCKAVKCHFFTWGIISFCNFPLSEKSGYLCIARTGDMESSNDWYASNVEVDAIWYYEQECDGCLKVKETRSMR